MSDQVVAFDTETSKPAPAHIELQLCKEGPDHIVRLSATAAHLSGLVRAALVEDSSATSIVCTSLGSYDYDCVLDIAKYLDYHAKNGFKALRGGTMKYCQTHASNPNRPVITCRKFSKYVRDDWDVAFLDLRKLGYTTVPDAYASLTHMWAIANYLEIPQLTDLVSLKQATMLFGQSPARRRWIMGLKNDWKPDEYRRAREQIKTIQDARVVDVSQTFQTLLYVDSDDDFYDSHDDDTDSDLDLDQYPQDGLAIEQEIEAKLLRGEDPNPFSSLSISASAASAATKIA